MRTENKAAETKKDKTLYLVLVSAALVIVTVVAFEQVRLNGFVNYDDDTYVTENPRVKAGLTTESVSWAFTTGHGSNWHPLTWVSHMVDVELFGLDPGGHHLVNLFFHVLNTLLLFLVLKRMTGGLWQSAFVAAIFALHPLHVESVAWVAERKDVLSAFFWMLTMSAYLRYVKNPGTAKYLLVVFCLCLGLLSKPMVVTLPFVLLLLDWWPLKRFSQSPFSRLLLEKVPLFILITASSIITFIAQKKGGAMVEIETVSLDLRIMNALESYIRYLGKLVYPARLSPLYPLSTSSPPLWKPVICLVVLASITAVVFRLAKRYGYVFTGWLWYFGVMVPVIGLVQVGGQSMADRYMYLPCIGILICAAWGVSELTEKIRFRKKILGVATAMILVVLLQETRLQVTYWKDNFTLFSRALEVTKGNYVMHNNLAVALLESGRIDEGIEHYRKSLEIRKNSPEVYNNLGNALQKQKKHTEAIQHYNKALELDPTFLEAHYNLANTLREIGRNEESIKHYTLALESIPVKAGAHHGLGRSLADLGRFQEAIVHYNKALVEKPSLHRARYDLAVALVELKKYDEAITQIQALIRTHPKDADLYCNLAIIYQYKGDLTMAIQALKKALDIDPSHRRALNALEGMEIR